MIFDEEVHHFYKNKQLHNFVFYRLFRLFEKVEKKKKLGVS